MLRKFGILLLVAAVSLCIIYRDLLSYGWMQAKGQLHILRNVREVSEILENPSYPDSVKQKILLIQEIKKFGVDSLGLSPSRNYTTFYDQQGKKLMWLLTASEKYKVEAVSWKFPVVGEFPYKGFFDSTRAYSEKAALAGKGYDTHMGEAAAWSMLGYVRDPILSGMLERTEGRLANLILHELTHGTLFVKGDMELNENLASFVGDWGAVQFLNYKYGPDSPQLKRYELQKKYQDAWSQHMLRGAGQLDSLYSTFTETLSSQVKDSLKQEVLDEILSRADTLLEGKYPLDSQAKASGIASSNAYFISYKTYRSRQNVFREEFSSRFNSNFPRYLHYLKQKYPSL
ncbi:MAG: aminopeptidase [Cytophagaceae bacterium SCN 52-12]|nr:MAG: aminopeptidase [Cytophagaceae bacterium SCN 52-12]